MFDLGVTTEQIIAYLLVFARVGAWVWLTPPLGGRFLPPSVRILAGLAFALPLTPSAIASSSVLPTTSWEIIGSLVIQVVIGIALGLVCLTLLSAVQSAGATIDVLGGFSLAAAYDPLMMQQSSVMARFYQLLGGVLILVTGAYMILFKGFQNTFEALPIGAVLDFEATAATLTTALSTFFVATLQIAGPIIVIMLLADVGLGLLTRVAPQINVFTLSFPVKIGLTFLLVGISLPHLVPMIAGLTDSSVDAMRGIAGG